MTRLLLPGAVVVGLLFPDAVGPARQPRRPPPPTPAERRLLHGRSDPARAEAMARELETAMLAPGAPVDVQSYALSIKVIPAPARRVEGTVRMIAQSRVAGLASLDVGLYSVMAVSSVTRGGLPLAFTRPGNIVRITLDRPYGVGETIDVTIAYGGTPPTVGYGAFNFGTHGTAPIITSLSEPTYATAWWPCIDHPADKAIVSMDLNVPNGLVGVSNGLLAGTVPQPDGTVTWQWRSSYPISTYLVSVAISNYVTWTDSYPPVTGGPPMLVQHWAYPEHEAAARADFSVTVPQLQFFSTRFVEYPFVQEKYGHAIFNFGGGMEHQTATSYGASAITGDHRYDWIVAHEMAHQWWGDSVSPATWDDIWLNEGFATYSEALWWEHLYGSAGLRDYVSSLDSRPFCSTVYAPSSACGLFGHTVYDKGGWVLHMLRRVMGDQDFFDGLRVYEQTHHHGNASTDDLRATLESVSGLDLDGFFARWLTMTGEPHYRWGWSAAPTTAGWVTYVRIEQIQTEDLFDMPVDLRLVTPSGAFDHTVAAGQRTQDFVLPPVPQAPTQVLLDPDQWLLETSDVVILADSDTDGVPDGMDNCAGAPNSDQQDLDGDDQGDLCDGDIDGDTVANEADCAPRDAGASAIPSEVTGLDVTGGETALLSWDAAPGAGGSIVYDVVRGDPAGLSVNGSGSCFAAGLGAPAASDGEPLPEGAAFWYLVAGRNVCGSGSLGQGSSGAPRPPTPCP